MSGESTLVLNVAFTPTGDTPQWDAKEIARRIENFLAVELEAPVSVKVNSAFIYGHGLAVNGEQFARGYTPEAAAYEQRTRRVVSPGIIDIEASLRQAGLVEHCEDDGDRFCYVHTNSYGQRDDLYCLTAITVAEANPVMVREPVYEP